MSRDKENYLFTVSGLSTYVDEWRPTMPKPQRDALLQKYLSARADEWRHKIESELFKASWKYPSARADE